MHKRIGRFIFAFLCVTLWSATSAVAEPTTLSVVDPITGSDTITILSGDPIEAQIVVDDAAIAGASFTVVTSAPLIPNTTDNAVTSDFFDTFVNQGLLDPTAGDPAYVTVDSEDYYSPIVEHTPSSGQLMIAAARVENGSGTDAPILSLHFEAAATGNYSISITQSIISNVDAGYEATGEAIPYLVAIDGADYVSYGTTEKPVTTYGATVIVLDFVDSENGGTGDGIDDNWELLYVATTDVLTATGDYDNDGYSDYQEYLNRNELDPSGNPYDPTIANAAGGTGYSEPNIDTPAVIPAIKLLLLGN